MPPLSDLHRDVIAAIQLVPRFNRERFDMRMTKHYCGAPACALGNLRVLDRALVERIQEHNTGLFLARLSNHIKSPEQWRDHAIKWLKDQGVDYYKVTAQVNGGATMNTSGAASVDTLPAAVSPESEFHMLIARLREKQSV